MVWFCLWLTYWITQPLVIKYMTNQTSDSTNFDQIHIKNLPKPISTSNCLYPNQDCDNIYFSEYDFRIHVFSSYRKINWHNWQYYIILSHMKLIQGFTVFYKIKKKKNCFTLQWHESLRWEFLMNIFLLWNASIMNLQKNIRICLPISESW